MTQIRHYTFDATAVSKFIVDETNSFIWIAFKKDEDGICHLKKVSVNDFDQVYFDVEIEDIDQIIDLIIIDGYIYALYSASTGTVIAQQFSATNPFTDFYTYYKPFGVQTPAGFTTDGNLLYILLPDSSGGVHGKILTYFTFDDGQLNESVTLSSLLPSAELITNESSITIDSNTNLWIVTYTSPVKLMRVWDDGSWNMQIRNINPVSFASKIIFSDPYLFIVTKTNPAKIIQVSINTSGSTTSAPLFDIQTLTGFSNAMDVAVNTNQRYIYVACSTGKLVKIPFRDISGFSGIDLSDSDNLLFTGALSDSYLAFASTDNTTGEAYIIDQRQSKNLSTNFQCIAELFATISTDFNVVEGKTISTDFKCLAYIPSTLSTVFSILPTTYATITSMSRTDWHVYIDDVELIPSDLDLKSITIQHTIDEQSTANFTLARRHDQLNTVFNGGIITITNQNTVKIYIGTNLEFSGKIAELNTVYDKSIEKVNVVAYATQQQEQYNTVLLPLPGLNENRSLYHIILQNPQIYNPYIDPTDLNPKKFLGVSVKLGKKITESAQKYRSFGDTGQLASDILDGTFKPKQNYTYFWFVGVTKVPPPQVTATTATPNPGSNTGFFDNSNADISDIQQFFIDNKMQFQDLNTSLSTIFDTIGLELTTDFPAFTSTSVIGLQYVGTSLAGLTSKLWVLRNASYFYQRERTSIEYKLGEGTITTAELEEQFVGRGSAIFSDLLSNQYIDSSGNIQEKFKKSQSTDDFDSSFGKSTVSKVYSMLEDRLVYTLGAPPYKDVSTRNGIYVAQEQWSDEADGLYLKKADDYNFVAYNTKVAELEYSKIKNINGQILPIAKVDISLTLDAYYYYNLKLLTRVNIDNTTESNIYNGNNGFPTSIKTINISSADMQVQLVTDNQKSSVELKAIDGEYPDEDSPDFNNPGYFIKQYDKYDLQSESKVE